MPGAAEIKSHRWSTRLKTGESVSLINDYGDLLVRASGNSGLEFAGVIQMLDGEFREPEFDTNRLPGKLEIQVKAPESWNGRVDASARVPSGSPLFLHTDQGLIEVRTSENDVVASTHTGRLSVRTQGHIEGRSASGDLLIVILGTDFEVNAGYIHTVTGDIEVWLQPNSDITLHASAGRDMDLDELEAAAKIQNTSTNVQVIIGTGSARLDVETEQGSVVVRTLPSLEQVW